MSTFNKTTYTTKWIKVKDLCVIWAQSQQPYNEKRAKKIAAEFDADYFGVISATLPDKSGRHHVIDGQHRVGAIRMLFGDEEPVPCNVYQTSDPAEAAQIFDKINTGRKNPRAIDIFLVRVTAGNEVEVAVDSITRTLGYKVTSGDRDGIISACTALTHVYKRHGGDVLRSALGVIKAVWGKDRNAVDAPIIRGFGSLVAECGVDVKWERLIERVSKKFTPGRLVGAARAWSDAHQCTLDEAVKQILIKTGGQRGGPSGGSRKMPQEASKPEARKKAA